MFAEQMMPKARERLATIDAAAQVTEAAALMARPHIDLLVVCGSDGVMVGVVTKTDIVGQIGRLIEVGCAVRVDAIMTSAVDSCQPGERLEDIWATMKRRGLQRIPVLDELRRPVGIIYARDALQSMLGGVESDEALLRDYVMNVGYR